MGNHIITVNGRAYAITVEEGAVSGIVTALAAPAAPTAPIASAPTPAAAPVPVVAPAGAIGSVSVSASIPGKVVAVKVAVGQAVKRGDVILVLETMRVRNDIVTPWDGTIASINTSTGDSVKSGMILTALNWLQR